MARSDQSSLLRLGGLSALATGIGYVVIVGLYVPMGPPPAESEARLIYLARNLQAWWAVIALSVVTDFLFLPVAWALNSSLKHLNPYAMTLACVLVGLFVVLDTAITWVNYAVLMTFSARYAAAGTEGQRAAIIALAEYPVAVLDSGLLFVYNSLTLAAGIFVTGLVMRKGVFSRAASYLALATGGVGIVSVLASFWGSALSFGIVITSILTTAWLCLVGMELFRLARGVH